MVARAYWDKGAWADALSWATEAIAENASNAQAHLWKADALRQMGAASEPGTQRVALYRAAAEDYRSFLKLTNFESSPRGEAGIPISSGSGPGAGGTRTGRRRGAACARRGTSACASRNVETPIRSGHASTAGERLTTAEHDPIAHFLLGNVNRDLFNIHQTCEYLSAAARSYSRMLDLNEHLVESGNARNYREQITGIARQLGC